MLTDLDFIKALQLAGAAGHALERVLAQLIQQQKTIEVLTAEIESARDGMTKEELTDLVV